MQWISKSNNDNKKFKKFNITQKFDGDENEKKIEGPCNTGLDWITDQIFFHIFYKRTNNDPQEEETILQLQYVIEF